MKLIILLISFFLTACEPWSLENERVSELQDDAEGRTRYEIPDIREIGLNEVRESTKKNCETYENHASRSIILGKDSPFNAVVNCIAYNIDKGLKPVCDIEKEVREELDNERNSRRQEELEIYLEDIEAEKALFVDHIYDIADPVYESCADIEDHLDDEIDNINSGIGRALWGFVSDAAFNSECRRIYRVMESKAGLACVDLDFASRRNRR